MAEATHWYCAKRNWVMDFWLKIKNYWSNVLHEVPFFSV